MASLPASWQGESGMLYPKLRSYVLQRVSESNRIPAERKARLEEIARYVDENVRARREARLVFICTHNSRRSQMAQIWAKTVAHYYNITPVETYSGGTEASAFNPRAVAALERAGFRIEPKSSGPNPLYHVTFCEDGAPLETFSKVFDDPPNPRSDFCAVMTCSQADEGCPFVPGASARVSIPYEDPKDFDGTGQETEKYDERCRQLSREMLYVFSRLKT